MYLEKKVLWNKLKKKEKPMNNVVLKPDEKIFFYSPEIIFALIFHRSSDYFRVVFSAARVLKT